MKKWCLKNVKSENIFERNVNVNLLNRSPCKNHVAAYNEKQMAFKFSKVHF